MHLSVSLFVGALLAEKCDRAITGNVRPGKPANGFNEGANEK